MRQLSDRQKDLLFAALQTLMLAGGAWLLLDDLGLESLWFDEAFSAVIVRHDWPQLLRIVAGDFSPPLYYVLLKVWTSVAGSTSAFAVRSFSAAAMLGLAALGATLVRGAAGRKAGVAFTFLVLCAPSVLQYGQEARMYALAALSVTVAALLAHRALRTDRTAHWIAYGLASVVAMYLHYYALLAVLVLGLWTAGFAFARGRRALVHVVAVGIGAVLLYSPWIIVSVEQAQRATASYWIGASSLTTVWNTMLYPFGFKFAAAIPGRKSELLLLLMVAFALVGATQSWLRRARRGAALDLFLIIVPTTTFFAVILGGELVSILLRPILLDRYSIPASGLLFLGAAAGIARVEAATLCATALAAYAALAVPRIVEIKDAERGLFNGGMKALYLQYRDKVRPGDVFVHSNEQTLGTALYYFPDNQHLFYLGKPFYHFSNYAAMLPNGRTVESLDELRGAQRVWNVHFIGDTDALPQEELARLARLRMTQAPVKFEEKRSWFNVSIAGFEHEP